MKAKEYANDLRRIVLHKGDVTEKLGQISIAMLREFGKELDDRQVTDGQVAKKIFEQIENKWFAFVKLARPLTPGVKWDGFRILALKHFPKLRKLLDEIRQDPSVQVEESAQGSTETN